MRERLNQRFDSQALMKAALAHYLTPDMDLYDVGCGTKPFADFLHGKVRRHIGIDIDYGFYSSEHIDLVGSADNLPLESGVADAILSSQVIEHLADPLRSFSEAARALRPGGFLFLSYPYLYPIHAPPYDFMRFSQFATRKALLDVGLELIDMKTLGGFWYLLGALTPIYLQGLAPLRILKLTHISAWIVRGGFGLLHRLEGAALRAMRKDVESARATWAVTYVLVAQKPIDAQ